MSFNCAAFADTNLQRSELFGHVKGSYSGAIEKRSGLCKTADGKTLFLDEAGWLTVAATMVCVHEGCGRTWEQERKRPTECQGRRATETVEHPALCGDEDAGPQG